MDQITNRENHPILSFILNPENDPPENHQYDFFQNERKDEEMESMSLTKEDVTNLRDQPQSTFEDSSYKDEVILSILWQKGQIGAAYYSLEKSQISFVGDVHDSKPDFIVCRNLFDQCRPRYVLTLQRMSSPFVDTLKELTGGNTDILRILPCRDYQWQVCERRARDIRLPSVPKEASEDEYRLYLLSSIDWNSSVAIHALGLLLRYLDRSYSELAMCAHGTPAPVLALEPVHLNSLVHMDSDTIAGLQIFCGTGGEQMVSSISSIPMSKQGLSLLGILNRTRCRLGSQRLRSLLMQPINDKKTLEARYDLIEWACESINREVVNSVHKCLRHIRDPTMVITRLGGGRPTPRDWWALHRTLYHALLVAAYLKPHRNRAPLLEEIVTARHSKLDHALFCLTKILDFDGSTENTMNIQEGIVPKLDSLRIQRESLPEMLTKIAEQELSKLPTRVKHCSVHYLPEMGFLLTLPLNENSESNNSTNHLENEAEGFEHMFNAGTMAYYKSERMRQLDTQLGDTQREIWCIEAAIMLRLVEFIQILTPVLMCLVRPLSELDALLGLALISNERGYIRPTLLEEPSMLVKAARHPLQELCVESFIPNDINLSLDDYRILLLTGANAAGKSVYLKQVGLIAFMAHIGCFVPAESASIGLIDAIYSRIHSVESTAQQLSAFMLDLKQVSLAVRGATRRSIVLLDEFGKGTNEVDGMSLLVATVEQWARRGPENCCHLIISTHLLTAARLIMESKHTHLKAKYFEHILDHDGQMVYLYRLVPGIAETSQALLTAANVGVPEALISRAREILESFDPNKSEALKPLSVLSNRHRSMIEFGRQFLSRDLQDENDVAELKERLALILSHSEPQPPPPPPPLGRFSPKANISENRSVAMEQNQSNILLSEQGKLESKPSGSEIVEQVVVVEQLPQANSPLSKSPAGQSNKRPIVNSLIVNPLKFIPGKPSTSEPRIFPPKSPYKNDTLLSDVTPKTSLSIPEENDERYSQESQKTINESPHENLFLQNISTKSLINQTEMSNILGQTTIPSILENSQSVPEIEEQLPQANSPSVNLPAIQPNKRPIVNPAKFTPCKPSTSVSLPSKSPSRNDKSLFEVSPKTTMKQPHENLFLQNISTKSLMNSSRQTTKPSILENCQLPNQPFGFTYTPKKTLFLNSDQISRPMELSENIPLQREPSHISISPETEPKKSLTSSSSSNSESESSTMQKSTFLNKSPRMVIRNHSSTNSSNTTPYQDKAFSQNSLDKRKPTWKPFLTSPPPPKRATPLNEPKFYKSQINFNKTL